MTMASWNVGAYQKTPALDVTCRKKERDRGRSHPYKVIEITPPPKNLGIRCFPPVSFSFSSFVSSNIEHRTHVFWEIFDNHGVVCYLF
ncbi:hypothetical protein NC652_038029 [Populus alba x Populus x berolinensis]|nr:hypothetical protein NC652_038029 [Populus alba x Populus x berolinensis]